MQDALETALNDPDASPADAIEAGATLIEITSGGDRASPTRRDSAAANTSTLGSEISAGNYTAALKIFMGDKSEAEIKATLDNLLIMASTLSTMQTLSQNTSGVVGTVNSTLFLFRGEQPWGFCRFGADGLSLEGPHQHDRGGSLRLWRAILSTSPITARRR